MYVLALATDYDGTIAHHGKVDEATLAALGRFRDTGRRLILVTGRDLPDLRRALPDLGLFDRVVAENGALVYDPKTDRERVLAEAPPPAFVDRLIQSGVSPLAVGKSIVATWEPNETKVLEVIQELGLELQVIFNKGAVMVLPSGINKAAGLAAALAELELSPVNVVGVGDAENDHAFLRSCGCSATVANALPMLKAEADIELSMDHGAGVIELMDRICRDDGLIVPAGRHGVVVGTDLHGNEVFIEPYGGGVLIAGTSGIGKSTFATALTERMSQKHCEFCILDPEGDYDVLEHAVSIGGPKAAPQIEQVIELLRELGANVVVNTQSLGVAERPPFFAQLLGRIATLRAATGRPHWLLIDEAHHLLPASREDLAALPGDEIRGAVFITVHPEAVSAAVLAKVAVVIALGSTAPDVITAFCAAIGETAPNPPDQPQPSATRSWSGFAPAIARRDG